VCQQKPKKKIAACVSHGAADTARQVFATPKNQPIEITSSGETRNEDGIAIAHGNVAIHTGDTDIYADSARYNSKTHEVFAEVMCGFIASPLSTSPNAVFTTSIPKRFMVKICAVVRSVLAKWGKTAGLFRWPLSGQQRIFHNRRFK